MAAHNGYADITRRLLDAKAIVGMLFHRGRDNIIKNSEKINLGIRIVRELKFNKLFVRQQGRRRFHFSSHSGYQPEIM